MKAIIVAWLIAYFFVHTPMLSLSDNRAGGYFIWTNSLKEPRSGASTVRLHDGRIAIIGGHGNRFVSHASLELYSNGEFTLVPLTYKADGSAVARMKDGKLLIAGGSDDYGIPAFKCACIFDPVTYEVTTTGNLNLMRASSGAATLHNGSVLLAGAWWTHNDAHTWAELYNSTTMTFSFAGRLNTPRSSPLVIPTSDSNAVVFGGIKPTGGRVSPAVEKYDRNTSSYQILREYLISESDPLWHARGYINRPIDECRTLEGKYIFLAERDINGIVYYALVSFDPTTYEAKRLAIYPPLPTSAEAPIVSWILDAERNKVYLLCHNPENAREIRLYTVQLSSLVRNEPTGWFTYGDYPINPCFGLLSDGSLLLCGGSTDGTNFGISSRAVIIEPSWVLSVGDTIASNSTLSYYPSPIQNWVVIEFTLSQDCSPRLMLYDLRGTLIQEFVHYNLPAGRNRVAIDLTSVANGAYLCRLHTNTTALTRMMIICE